MAYTLADIDAVHRLLKIAQNRSGQSRRIANFLLAWWNANRDGGFDLTDLWNVDTEIAEDMVTVFRMVSLCRYYPDHFGLREDFEGLVTHWRGRA